MTPRYLKRCPKCSCKELEELEAIFNGPDGIECLMSCIDCDFKCTFHYGFMGWTSEEPDAQSDEPF